MRCDANTTEFCGAGNRLAVYQDSSATPISPGTCITGRGPWDFGGFGLQAVPVDSAGAALVGGVIKQIYAVLLNFNLQNTVQYTILSVSVCLTFSNPLSFLTRIFSVLLRHVAIAHIRSRTLTWSTGLLLLTERPATQSPLRLSLAAHWSLLATQPHPSLRMPDSAQRFALNNSFHLSH